MKPIKPYHGMDSIKNLQWKPQKSDPPQAGWIQLIIHDESYKILSLLRQGYYNWESLVKVIKIYPASGRVTAIEILQWIPSIYLLCCMMITKCPHASYNKTQQFYKFNQPAWGGVNFYDFHRGFSIKTTTYITDCKKFDVNLLLHQLSKLKKLN